MLEFHTLRKVVQVKCLKIHRILCFYHANSFRNKSLVNDFELYRVYNFFSFQRKFARFVPGLRRGIEPPASLQFYQFIVEPGILCCENFSISAGFGGTKYYLCEKKLLSMPLRTKFALR
jgi:hypothetical protein